MAKQAKQQAMGTEKVPESGPGRAAMARGSSAQPEQDELYGLVSVLYHALQGAETYSKYIADAERAGDEELVEFFNECREEEAQRAVRAKELLVERADTAGEDEESDDDSDDEE